MIGKIFFLVLFIMAFVVFGVISSNEKRRKEYWNIMVSASMGVLIGGSLVALLVLFYR